MFVKLAKSFLVSMSLHPVTKTRHRLIFLVSKYTSNHLVLGALSVCSSIQDVWLKMHSGDGFARIKGDLARLLSIYRSASLEVVEAMMRHPQLEKVADAFTKKKVCLVHVVRCILVSSMPLIYGSGPDGLA